MNLRRMRENLRVVPIVMEMTLRQNVMDGFIVFTVLVQPLLIALMGLWMLRDKGPEYGIYVVVGSGMTGLWSSLLFIGGNSVNTERHSGTLETLVGVPTPLSVVIFAKNLASVLQSLVSMVATYLLASLIFGYPLTLAMPGLFFASIVFCVAAFISFGLILAPLFVMNPQLAQFQNGLEFPVYLLSGFLFPVLMLPGWTGPISRILPTYWAARALHASSSGGTTGEVLLSWAALAVLCAAYLFITGKLFGSMIRKAKRDAVLDIQ